MLRQVVDQKELDEHGRLLFAPVGEAGSGRVRYAAAMHFYQRGMLSAGMLEIYRRCCKLDCEDPIALARHECISTGFVDTLQTGQHSR